MPNVETIRATINNWWSNNYFKYYDLYCKGGEFPVKAFFTGPYSQTHGMLSLVEKLKGIQIDYKDASKAFTNFLNNHSVLTCRIGSGKMQYVAKKKWSEVNILAVIGGQSISNLSANCFNIAIKGIAKALESIPIIGPMIKSWFEQGAKEDGGPRLNIDVFSTVLGTNYQEIFVNAINNFANDLAGEFPQEEKKHHTIEEANGWIEQQIRPAYKTYLGRDMMESDVKSFQNELMKVEVYPMTQDKLNGYINYIINSEEAKNYKEKKGEKGKEAPKVIINWLPLLLIAGIGYFIIKKKPPIRIG
jgi:hypothetical protein